MTATTHPGNIDDVLSRLTSVKSAGQDKFTAACPCPGHETPAKHLSVHDAGDKALVTCFPGTHDYADICKALGYDSLTYSLNGHRPLEPAPVPRSTKKQPNTQTTKGTVVATFDYQDANQVLLFQTVKYDPKDFRQRRPDGNGGWLWNLTNVPLVLYHLHDLETAVAYGETVLFCEGEKDSNNAANLGYIATTSPLGAGKYRPEYSETLRGATVVIVPDLDEPGLKHGSQVAFELWGVAMSIKILTLPSSFNGQPVKDLSDWIGAGGDRDTFDELLAECCEYQPPDSVPDGSVVLRRMADIQAETVTFLWDPYIPQGKVTLAEGDPGVGKSTAMLAVASGLSRGELYGAGRMQPANVLLASAEDGLADTVKPRLSKLGADTSRIYAMDGLLTLDDQGMAILEKNMAKLQPRLAIVDPIVAYLGGELDINKANQIRHVMAQLARLAEQYRTAIIVVRHLTKGSSLKPIYRGLGSIDFTAAARSVLLAGEDPETGARALIHIKCNLAALGPAVGYELTEAGFAWTGASDLTAGRILAADDGGTQRADAVEFLIETLAEPTLASQCYQDADGRGISKRTLDRAKKQLGVVAEKETTKNGQWYWRIPNAQ